MNDKTIVKFKKNLPFIICAMANASYYSDFNVSAFYKTTEICRNKTSSEITCCTVCLTDNQVENVQ